MVSIVSQTSGPDYFATALSEHSSGGVVPLIAEVWPSAAVRRVEKITA